jgi:predicted nucleic acid-binding protein
VRYLLDTMVVSEAARPAPNAGVVKWLEEQASPDLAISVLTIGEIARGVTRMADGKRKRALREWLATSLPAQFEGRVLVVDADVALAWGELTAQGDDVGRPLPVTDGLLLATARVHELTLVTRNVGDVAGRGVEVLNPWQV